VSLPLATLYTQRLTRTNDWNDNQAAPYLGWLARARGLSDAGHGARHA